jgi:uncharacterized membrane protein YqhA
MQDESGAQDEPGSTVPNPESEPARNPAPEPNPEPSPLPQLPALAVRAERALAASLRLTVIPVAFLVLAALGAFAYGIAVFVHGIMTISDHPFPVRHQLGLFLLDIDLFLIGATLLISAVGLYELFVREIRDEGARMPAWLNMHDLNDLKARVIAMIVLVIAVSFAEEAVDVEGSLRLLELGGGIALVIVALTAFLLATGHGRD